MTTVFLQCSVYAVHKPEKKQYNFLHVRNHGLILEVLLKRLCFRGDGGRKYIAYYYMGSGRGITTISRIHNPKSFSYKNNKTKQQQKKCNIDHIIFSV